MYRLTLLILAIVIHSVTPIQWSYGGDWAWASNCDFWGNDMGSKPTDAANCGPTCQATPGCTHFAWTPNTCWMKKNSVSQGNAYDSGTAGIVCGLKITNSQPSTSSYSLVQHYDPDNLVYGNDWDFFTGADPTHGFVNFLDSNTARNTGILKVGNAHGKKIAHFGSAATGNAPNSIRVSSKRSFTGGLLTFDATHIPTGCGTWPAFWSFGPNWPHSGEIDILEGVHGIGNNAMTLHTSPGCNSANLDCNAGNAFQGCSIHHPNGGTFGPSFNNNPGGGGVYAMEWVPGNNGFIKIWVFPRNSVPGDIASANPNPGNWPAPNAYFPLGNSCPSSHFINHNIIIDLTFCGDWAGATFGQQCAWTGKSCVDYLRNNAGALWDAYFEIVGIRLYQSNRANAEEDANTNLDGNSVNSEVEETEKNLKIAVICLGAFIGFLVIVVVFFLYRTRGLVEKA